MNSSRSVKLYKDNYVGYNRPCIEPELWFFVAFVVFLIFFCKESLNVFGRVVCCCR